MFKHGILEAVLATTSLTHRELAVEIGVSQPTISRWGRHKVKVTPENKQLVIDVALNDARYRYEALITLDTMHKLMLEMQKEVE